MICRVLTQIAHRRQITTKRPLVMNQPEIGKLIRELRLKTGLTQEQFAAELGVTCPTVNRWENNRATPSPMALKLIEEMRQRINNNCEQIGGVLQ